MSAADSILFRKRNDFGPAIPLELSPRSSGSSDHREEGIGPIGEHRSVVMGDIEDAAAKDDLRQFLNENNRNTKRHSASPQTIPANARFALNGHLTKVSKYNDIASEAAPLPPATGSMRGRKSSSPPINNIGAKEHFTPELLNSIFRLEDGRIIWRARSRETHPGWTDRRIASWNASFANRETRLRANPEGYLSVMLRRHRIAAHRLAWVLTHGSWPSGVIDRINRDPADNRICNLRDVTQRENSLNRAVVAQRNEARSSLIGVHRARDRWIARLRVGGTRITLGVFGTPQEAVAARIGALKAIASAPTISRKEE